VLESIIPTPTLQGPGREAEDIRRVENIYGPDSQEAQRAKRIYEAQQASREALVKTRGRTLEGLKSGEMPVNGDDRDWET
jgi:hypothetical protein